MDDNYNIYIGSSSACKALKFLTELQEREEKRFKYANFAITVLYQNEFQNGVP